MKLNGRAIHLNLG